jgi:type IV pilus assembly protein PilM
VTKRVVGLDFGRKSIRAAQLRQVAGKMPCIEKLYEIDIPAGVSEYGEILDRPAFTALLTKLWQKAGFETRHVVISAGSLHVFAREIDVPQMSLQRIRESLPFVLDGVLPVPADQLFLDFYPIEEGVEETGLTYRGLAIAAEKSHVEALVSCVTAAKLRPMAVDFAPFALLRSSLDVNKLEKLQIYIDVGGGATYFLIAKGQVPLFVRILPNGGNDVDRTMAAALRITEEEAESLRRAVSLTSEAKDGAEVRAATMAALQELLSSLSSTIDYYEQSHKVSLRQDCVVTLSGGVAKLAGIDKILEAAINMPVTLNGKIKNAMACEGLKVKDSEESNFLLAIGLALAEVNHA